MRAAHGEIDAPMRAALLKMARAARANAHAPYSRFRVGAAVLDDRGRLFGGCNVENASYGLTICAERNAIAAAVGAGAKRIHAVAVITPSDPPGTPCGACRQVLAEFGDEWTPVLLGAPVGAATVRRLGALLPESFSFSAPRPAKPRQPGKARKASR